jgi:hypothetical protein
MNEEFGEKTSPETTSADVQNDIPIAEHVPPANPHSNTPVTGVIDGGESADKDRPKRLGRPSKVKPKTVPAGEGDNTDAGDKPKNQLAETSIARSPPRSENESLNPSGKVRIKHDGMADKKIFLRRGEVGTFDNEGILEVEIAEAERLLSIPGYKRA